LRVADGAGRARIAAYAAGAAEAWIIDEAKAGLLWPILTTAVRAVGGITLATALVALATERIACDTA
jgi:hypothetical protein